jgi:hypothetical protein
MLAFLRNGTGRAKLRKLSSKAGCERKQRLFLVGCCRRIWPLIIDARSSRAVEVAERYVEGVASKTELATAERDAAFAYAALRSTPDATAYCAACPPVQATHPLCRGGFGWCCYGSDVATMAPAFQLGESSTNSRYDETIRDLERSVQADLIRDIFGNPFLTLSIDIVWITSTVTSLASAAYEERSLPSGELTSPHLAVLSDALEEAGCDSAALLDHLRSPGPHVRGCWALDLVLGKG